MTMNYRQMLEDGYQEVASHIEIQAMTRLEYLGDYIFDFTTYDGEMTELFAKKAVDVCAVISNRTTFQYIEDPENYRWYLIMVNMPFFEGKLSWGGSIRGAWWDGGVFFESSGLCKDGEQLTSKIGFTQEQWEEFISAVIDFANKEATV